MLHVLHQLVASFVSLLFGAERVLHVGFIAAFSVKKDAFHKTKTKMLKPFLWVCHFQSGRAHYTDHRYQVSELLCNNVPSVMI